MDGLSFGAGIEIMYLEFEQRALARTLLPLVTASEDIPARLKASSMGFGGNASILYEPVDWLSMGFIWRSQMKHVLKGSAKYDKVGKPAANTAGIYEDSDAHGNLMLPQSFTGGIAIKPLDNFVVEFDATWTGWSSYEEFKVIYNKNPYNSSVDATDVVVKDWKDVWQFNVGLEYGLTNWMDIRFGYAYDFSPQSDAHLAYSLPTGNRQWFAGGLGFNKGNWNLDASYTYLISAARDGNILVSDRTVFGSPQTTYHSEFKDTYAHLIGLSLGYKF